MCSLLCGRVSTTSLGAGAGLGLAGGPCWAAALWNCLCSVQILETFHTEPLPAYQKRRSSFSLCVFRGNMLVGRQERDCSPQWGCWSSLESLSAELHLVCCNFWLFAAAISSGPSWLKCLVNFQCLTGPALLETIVGPASSIPTYWAWASGQAWKNCQAATHSQHWQISSAMICGYFSRKQRKTRDCLTVITVKFCENTLQPYLKILLVVVVDMWDYV